MQSFFKRLDSSKMNKARAKMEAVQKESEQKSSDAQKPKGRSVTDLLNDDFLENYCSDDKTNLTDCDETQIESEKESCTSDCSQEPHDDEKEFFSFQDCGTPCNKDEFEGLDYESSELTKVNDKTDAVYFIALIYGVCEPAYCAYKVTQNSCSIFMVSKNDSLFEFFKFIDSIFVEIIEKGYLEVQIKAPHDILSLLQDEDRLPYKVKSDYMLAQQCIRFIESDTEQIIKDAIKLFV